MMAKAVSSLSFPQEPWVPCPRCLLLTSATCTPAYRVATLHGRPQSPVLICFPTPCTSLHWAPSINHPCRVAGWNITVWCAALGHPATPQCYSPVPQDVQCSIRLWYFNGMISLHINMSCLKECPPNRGIVVWTTWQNVTLHPHLI